MSSRYDGPERRRAKDRRRSTVVWKRVQIIWMIAFTLVVLWLLRQNNDTTQQNKNAIVLLNKTKASLASLQRTNCGLRSFLLSAHNARARQANAELLRSKKSTGAEKARDLASYRVDALAAKQYEAIIALYTGDGCTVAQPKPVQVRGTT